MPELTFAWGRQLELALLNKLLHTPLSPRKAPSDARCTQSIRWALRLCSAHGLKAQA